MSLASFIQVDPQWSADLGKEIEATLKNKPRLSDYTNINLYPKTQLAIEIVLCNILAKSVNHSLLEESQSENGWNDQRPTIIPWAMLLDPTERGILKLWQGHYSKLQEGSPELPEFVKIYSVDLNFMYCSTPLEDQESILNIAIFTSAFDMWGWILTAIAVCLVSFLSFSNCSQKPRFRTAVMPSLLPLLNESSESKWGQSVLLTLWVLVGSLLSNYYNGTITSQVIAPSQERTITKLSEFESKNFSFIYEEQFPIDLIMAVASSLDGIIETAKYLKNLAQVASVRNNVLNTTLFALELAEGNKLGTFTIWPYAIEVTLVANQLIAEKKTQKKIHPKTKCHVGNDMIDLSHIYYGFLPPRSFQLSINFHRLMQAGIVKLWHDEHVADDHSHRVQNRVKVVSPVKILDEVSVTKLELEGKIAMVFMILVICIIISLVNLIFEKFYHLKTSINSFN